MSEKCILKEWLLIDAIKLYFLIGGSLLLKRMKKILKYIFMIFPIATLLSACTHINDAGSPGGLSGQQASSNDVSITFSAWISEESKQAELEAVANKKAAIKCQGGPFKITNMNSTRYNFYPTINNAISANIQCINSQAPDVPLNRALVTEELIKLPNPEKNRQLLIENAKIRCTDLGFKSRSEEHAKCVIQLTK